MDRLTLKDYKGSEFGHGSSMTMSGDKQDTLSAALVAAECYLRDGLVNYYCVKGNQLHLWGSLTDGDVKKANKTISPTKPLALLSQILQFIATNTPSSDEPDTDGSVAKGFKLKAEDSLNIERGEIIIEPVWIIYGK